MAHQGIGCCSALMECKGFLWAQQSIKPILSRSDWTVSVEGRYTDFGMIDI